MSSLLSWPPSSQQPSSYSLILSLTVLDSSYKLLFSYSVGSNSFQPHGLHHTRLLCPLPSPRTFSNSCPLSWWCHPTISSSVIPFSSCLQSFPASGSFPMNQHFVLDGQRIGASASVLPGSLSELIFFRVNWFDLSAVQGTLKSLLQYHSSKASILWFSDFFMSSSHNMRVFCTWL